MSIGVAGVVRAAAGIPATPPTTLPIASPTDTTDAPVWLVAVLVIWAVVALVVARRSGVFRRGGIAGPERLPAADSNWTLVGFLGMAIVAMVVGSFAAGALVDWVLRPLHVNPSPDVATLLVGGLGEAIAVAIVLALVWALWTANRAGLRLIGLAPGGIPAALAGGTAALFVLFPLIQLAGMAVVWLYHALHLQQAKPHPVLEMMRAHPTPGLVVAAVLTASVVAPVAEELFFRGLMQTMLGRAFDWAAGQLAPRAPGSPRPAARWAAVVVTSVAFAAVHGQPAFLAPLFVLSLGLGFVYERSGNLWMNIVTHSLFNSIQIVLFLAGPR
jgi:membrane protease YdiL (CAAX protease family)